MSYIGNQLDKIFLNDDMSLNFAAVSDKIINLYFEDLEKYYSGTVVADGDEFIPANEAIRNRLIRALSKHSKKEILLIAHSMGSIIAYDVLSDPKSDFNVHTFVTIGSPLGMPSIVSRIVAEQNRAKGERKPAHTPDNVKNRWYNFSDPEDKVALDHTLRDDFTANVLGIQAIDSLVYNDYFQNQKRNPHKVYGYLRTPEMSEVIQRFIVEEQLSFTEKLMNKVFIVFNTLKTFSSKKRTGKNDRSPS